ncbi:hypothetical protein E4U60_006849 [Claviceps pazoutovae]|uniref:Uncharacterized protein n=1 Tax=Claviceps pazoutovae TaxID=1649127 RepID=A0A9P7MJ67_9HYPO|nr:hypothetical protein E4U60_006849 [Claviceps pazoutovae]
MKGIPTEKFDIVDSWWTVSSIIQSTLMTTTDVLRSQRPQQRTMSTPKNTPSKTRNAIWEVAEDITIKAEEIVDSLDDDAYEHHGFDHHL